MKTIFLVAFCSWLSLFTAPIAQAETIYVAPGGAESANGSSDAPWASVRDALASGRVKGGDTIRLAKGRYGRLELRGFRFSKPVSIVADGSGIAHFSAIEVSKSANLLFEGLSVWPDDPKQPRGHLIKVAPDAQRIVFSKLDVRSTETARNYLNWGQQTWLANKRPGILLEGPENAILGSRFTGVSGAISTTGVKARVVGNQIHGFSSDGIRSLGDHTVVFGNFVRDCVKIDDNHDDGFQSWSLGPGASVGKGVVRNLVIDSNTILEWTGPPEHPLRCQLQGIGLFDGFYEDLVIRNNVISVSSYHGIGVNGMRSGSITHNTVVNARGPRRNAPWIGVFSHKDGRKSSGVIVANNAAPIFKIEGARLPDMVVTNNYVMVYPQRDLVAPGRLDFRPKPTSALVNAADPRFAAKLDIQGTPRDGSGGPDIGAIELP